jgi:hypothetical protein
VTPDGLPGRGRDAARLEVAADRADRAPALGVGAEDRAHDLGLGLEEFEPGRPDGAARCAAVNQTLVSDVKRVSSHPARPDSFLDEQRAIEEADDALFVLGGALVDRLRVVAVAEIPELDRITCGALRARPLDVRGCRFQAAGEVAPPDRRV